MTAGCDSAFDHLLSGNIFTRIIHLNDVFIYDMR
jgi:hypothetical protein